MFAKYIQNVLCDFTGRLNASESLFWYRTGWGTNTYTDLQFVPMFGIPENNTLTAICNNNIECMYDIAMTNNTDLGEYTTMVLGEVETKAKTFGKLYYD